MHPSLYSLEDVFSIRKVPANFIPYETYNYNHEHFNWPYSIQTNLRVEKRSFFYDADIKFA